MIKEVGLVDQGSFGCTVQPFTGEFVIKIHGQVADFKDYSIPDDLHDISILASGLIMTSIISHESFKSFQDFMEKKHPEFAKFNSHLKSKSK